MKMIISSVSRVRQHDHSIITTNNFCYTGRKKCYYVRRLVCRKRGIFISYNIKCYNIFNFSISLQEKNSTLLEDETSLQDLLS